MLLQPTRSTRTYTPFPYTSLFRSRRVQPLGFREAVERAQKIAQGVAQPTVGVRLILQDLRPYLQVLRVVGGDDPEAQDVGAALGHHVLGRDHVAERLRHLAALLVEHEAVGQDGVRSEEHTSELQSLMRI